MKKNWKKEQIERREVLKKLSNTLKPQVRAGEFETINEALINYYKKENPSIVEFRTFRDWKQQGATIRKGEKAFFVWAQPRALRPGEKADDPEELNKEQKELKETFFPVCCLFANTQIITAEEKEQHRQAITAPESGHTHPINQEKEEEALPF